MKGWRGMAAWGVWHFAFEYGFLGNDQNEEVTWDV